MTPPEGLAELEGVVTASDTPAVLMIGRAWMRELLEYVRLLEREVAMAGRKGSRWPEDKVIRLRELEAEGVSIREMSRRMGCSEDTIFRQRVHAGMPRRPPPIERRTEPRPPKRVRQGVSTLPQLASLAGDEP